MGQASGILACVAGERPGGEPVGGMCLCDLVLL